MAISLTSTRFLSLLWFLEVGFALNYSKWEPNNMLIDINPEFKYCLKAFSVKTRSQLLVIRFLSCLKALPVVVAGQRVSEGDPVEAVPEAKRVKEHALDVLRKIK